MLGVFSWNFNEIRGGSNWPLVWERYSFSRGFSSLKSIYQITQVNLGRQTREILTPHYRGVRLVISLFVLWKWQKQSKRQSNNWAIPVTLYVRAIMVRFIGSKVVCSASSRRSAMERCRLGVLIEGMFLVSKANSLAGLISTLGLVSCFAYIIGVFWVAVRP